MSHTIKTPNPDVVLRPITLYDIDGIVDLAGYNAEFIKEWDAFPIEAASAESMRRHITSSACARGLECVIWARGELVGVLKYKYKPFPACSDNSHVLGYWLGEEYTGYGYMSAALRGLLTHIALTRFPRHVRAYVFKKNLPSQNLLERLGFVQVGESCTRVEYALDAYEWYREATEVERVPA